MKGQLSLEFLVLVFMCTAFFLFILPNVNALKEAGDYALNLGNAELILDKFAYACERVLITNSREALVVHALTNYSVSRKQGKTFLFFRRVSEIKHASKPTPCAFEVGEIAQGRNEFSVEFEDERAVVK